MNALEKLDKKELRELLNKCWMTHDGMWFSHCLKECGIDKTNKINRAAGRSVGMIEIKRIKEALGIEDVQSFQDLKDLTEGTYEVLRGEFMKITPRFPSENLIHWEWEGQKCFAYEGMKRLGVIDQYQCGIFERIGAWFDSLGIEYSVTPRVDGCMMHTDAKCFRDFKFFF